MLSLLLVAALQCFTDPAALVQQDDVLRSGGPVPPTRVRLLGFKGPLANGLAMSAVAQPAAAPREGRPAIGDHRQCITLAIPTSELPVQSGGDEADLYLVATLSDASLTSAQVAVIFQALGDWGSIITAAGRIDNPYYITFENGPLGGETITHTTTWFSKDGTLLRSTIIMDDDGSTNWWVDPSPGDDLEFDSDGACGSGQPCQGAVDLLSVLRHEIGHSLGWVGTFNPLVSSVTVGTTFDPTRLNVALHPMSSGHSDPTIFPNGLMNPGTEVGRRTSIALYPDASLIARAFDHLLVMRYVDAAYTGPEIGSANAPWNTLAEGLEHSPAEAPLLVIPGTYDEAPPSLVMSGARSITSANGGDAIVQ